MSQSIPPRKAQTGTELILLLVVLLGVTLTLIMVQGNAITGYATISNVNEAKSAVDNIADAAETMYKQSVGSRSKIYVTFPQTIVNLTFGRNYIRMTVDESGKRRDVTRGFRFNISGSLPATSGMHTVYIAAIDGLITISDTPGTLNISGPFCGDGFRHSSEACDGTSFGDATCDTFGYNHGTLSCTANCSIITIGCYG